MKKRDTAELCGIYNRATNPAALRTDREANLCRKLARLALQRLVREGHRFIEGEASGRLYPVVSA